ncbi:hypothetical protein [Ottowia thiooxydans]|uniref:hypothetical protein n=1 Tax=Ottowia thiooxydans TaxID=219182 RepID=UPI0012EBF930|nr:hypothetical protein [Ottowia thiooxydans]
MTKKRRVTTARSTGGQLPGKSFNFRASQSQRDALEAWADEAGISMTAVFCNLLDQEIARRKLASPSMTGRVSVDKAQLVQLSNVVMELGFVLEEIQIRATKRRRGKAKELFGDALQGLQFLREDLLCT